MKVVSVNEKVIHQLRNSGISREMKSLESSKWIVLEEYNNTIIGATGLGGIFHVSGIQIHKDYRGKGIGKILQSALVEEAKRRGYSFITVFVDPRNTASTKLHNSLGYKTIFRIHYSSEIIQDIKIKVLKPRGKIVSKLLGIFNTLIGIVFLALILKVSKPLFEKMILYNEEEIPDPSIRLIINNFEKIKN